MARYDSFKNAVNSLFRSGIKGTADEEFFLASDSDRYINVYNIQSKKLVRTLVAGSGVVSADLHDPSEDVAPIRREQLLAALTKDGIIELFWRPFALPEQANGDLKSSRKNLTRKAGASIRLISSDSKSKHIPIFAASVQGHDIVIASADSGADFSFQKIRWQDEGNGKLLFDGQKDLVKVRAASTLNTATLNGAKYMGKSHVDESKTVVVNGLTQPVTIDLASDESEDAADENDEEEEEDEVKDEATKQTNAVDGDEDLEVPDSDEEMAEADATVGANAASDAAMADPEVDAEPTFGELLASRHQSEIAISSSLPPDQSTTTLKSRPGAVLPSGMSLGTVLTQALRTNDNNLLEACLHTQDIHIVRNTIQRLDSQLAGVLLSRLAERLASRPGRYGNLIAWVQWTCIAHGGAIAAQPDATAKVRTLYQVLGQRTRTLDSLLLLKGKLDMLDAQLRYRKEVLSAQGGRREGHDEPGIIYIESVQEDNWESDDEEEDEDDDLDEDIERPAKRMKGKGGKGKGKGRKALEELIESEGESEDEDEDMMRLENGVAEEDEDEDDEDEDEDEDDEDDDDKNAMTNGHRVGLLDAEAEDSSAADSDPDDTRENPGLEEAHSDSDPSSSDSEERSEDDDDEDEDSDMDSFINDGSVDLESDEDDVHVDGDSEPEPEVVPAPVSVAAAPASRSSQSKPKSKPKGKVEKKKSGKQ